MTLDLTVREMNCEGSGSLSLLYSWAQLRVGEQTGIQAEALAGDKVHFMLGFS